MSDKQVPTRNLAMELVRVTEAAALAAARWVGGGDKNAADGAAVDAMRIVLDTVRMDGVVIIGEGEKDEAPMLYNGERIGDGTPPEADIAVDPIDGTTLTALGRGNAIAVIAVSERGSMYDPGPVMYMEKIAVGPEAADVIDITATPTENLHAVAKALLGGLADADCPQDTIDNCCHRYKHQEHHSHVDSQSISLLRPAYQGINGVIVQLFFLIGNAIGSLRYLGFRTHQFRYHKRRWG